jgi:hypothetical protein
MTDQQIWYQNITFWSALCAWFLAQTIKMVGHFAATKKIDFRYWVSTGGMPSAHSAMVCALATSVAFVAGLHSALFAVATAFAIVVMFDAQSVRHAAGMQARLLNQMVDELFKEKHFASQKLKEFLGHTPLEVFMGMILGILVGIVMNLNFG